MMAQNAEKTLSIALESLNRVYDELIIVDGGSTDRTVEIAETYGARVIHSPWPGIHSQQRNVYLQEVKTDWLFVLDSDEFIDRKTLDFLQSIRQNNTFYDKDAIWIPRKWISPFSLNQYITSSPHSPDFQCRLLKYSKELLYEGKVHETIKGLESYQIYQNLGIYHLDLFINSEEKRKDKVRRYMQGNPKDGAMHFYLPPLKSLQLTEWNFDELLPSVQNLLQELKSNSVEHSQLNQIIPPEIKNDEFYAAIQKVAKEEDLKTVLEIGSSSGGGSTEAFVKGLQENSNHPTLFCMEVSQPRFTELQNRYANCSFVKCYNVSSVSIEDFPNENEVIKFYKSQQTNLNFYPLKTVLEWLSQDIEYIKNAEVSGRGIEKIKQENKIDIFDAVLIDGSEFTGKVELEQVYGSKLIILDDINTFKNYSNYYKLLEDSSYNLVTQNTSVRNGYAIFKIKEEKQEKVNNYKVNTSELPIHFFTIVLNGEPFIRYHIDVFKQLPFKWHWHIIDGVADLKHDTSWSIKLGGSVIDQIHNNGRSKDGTSEYLDELTKLYPENVTVYRKPKGIFWDGKREMVNEPIISSIREECLLWQIDVDELWTVEQIHTARKIFLDNPEKTAAFYWCWYFVGEDLIISTRNCYTQNPQQDWLRTWRFKPGCVWVAHEPPILAEPLPNGQWRNIAAVNPFLHEETEKKGLIFQHFAYVTPEQLKFKEQYYGYKNAVNQWNTLQSENSFPVYLRQYFSWVKDQTMVDKVKSFGVTPIAQKDETDNWKFIQPSSKINDQGERQSPTIIVDGVFFQLYKTGIARVWRSLLEEWANQEFSKHIVVLDRVGTAPKIPGIWYRTIPAYDYQKTEEDRELLQQVCDEEGADLFISTYYTTPISTPSIFMAYDMIPEVLDGNLNEPMWREKHHGIRHASAYISISKNTASDLAKFFSGISLEEVTVAHCGVSRHFYPANAAEIAQFKMKYGITKPYFLLVGAGSNYKNAKLFFQGFAQLHSKQGFDIICTGSGYTLGNEYREFTSGCVVHPLQLSDEELKIAYSGATALVYPSLYEGFGMPVAEAMACGCPVITCPNASIPEVGGEAVIYVNHNNIEELADALCEVQKPTVRKKLITAGIEQAKKFSWEKMADQVSSALINATLLRLNLREINFIIFPDWSQPEESLASELTQVIKAVMTHPDKNKMTLLVDNGSIEDEEADLALSSVVMSLMMEEELEVEESAEIALIGELSDIQWSALQPRLQGRIVLEHENQEIIAKIELENKPVIKLNDLKICNFDVGLTPTNLRQNFSTKPLVSQDMRKVTTILEAISRNEKNILELGSGNQARPSNWITLDYYGYPCDINHDLKNPLPFPDKSIPIVYSSHVLEHFYYHELIILLQEIYRVLLPGGQFLICVPDAEIYIRGYLEPDQFDSEFYCQFKPGYNYYSPIDYINYMAYMGGHHKIMFDRKNLKSILESIGFTSVITRTFDPTYDLKERDHESIYFYAEKPRAYN
jgi:glycosyltransferase involved in cell wall biosynthesis/predicted SAM-dependent methyltransferase